MEIPMKTLAGIIVVITMLAIGMIIFFMYFMPIEWQIALTMLIIRTQALIRGVMIDLLWKVAGITIGLTVAYLLFVGRQWLTNPVTAAALAGIIAAIVGMILGLILAVQFAIPWYDIKTPTLELGLKGEGIDSSVLIEKTRDMVLDCWYAFQANKYDPLAGVPGFHPRRCATIHFNLSRPESMSDIYSEIKDSVLPASGAIEVKDVALGQPFQVYRGWNDVLCVATITEASNGYLIRIERDDCDRTLACTQNEVQQGECSFSDVCGVSGKLINVYEKKGTKVAWIIFGETTTLGVVVNLRQHNFTDIWCQEGYIYVEYGDCYWSIPILAVPSDIGEMGPWHRWYSPCCGIESENDVDCSKGDFVIICLKCES